ncbi:MAG: SMC-Scp complex subunit ScpB [Planctomycetaceae bacterium]|nr:SMC-Scp complex subunit ScpB [Planctomycetales bacterium]MCB9873818.1 SMC-Scp complex subunit ScpB [Planctomycetaceae bacterium]MCB9940017.1 SMC-Scp complex subunit ScpB [Planctomycetaceae bacterium]
MGRKHIENETTAEDLGLDGLAHPSDDHGLSLEDLSEAYAQLIDGGADPYQPEEIDEDEGEEDELDEQEEESGEVEVTPRSILESMLFVGSSNNEPLSGRLVAGLMRGVSPREIDELVRELNDAYDAEACPYHIVSAGAGYTMQLRPEFARLRDKFYGRVREAKLSQPAIDVLAMVAYRQPITRDSVSQLRGQSSGAVLSQLVRRELLRIERTEENPRVPMYYTTDRFLDLFGMASIDELPQSQEFDVSD